MDFKVGDKIKFLGGDGPPNGTLGVVLREKSGVSRPLVEFEGWEGGHSGGGFRAGSKNCWWSQPEEMELAGKTEETPKFSTGMKVRIVKDMCCHGIKNGTVVELAGKHQTRQGGWWVKDTGVYIIESDVEIVTEKTDKIAVKIASKDDWDKVLKKCYEMGSKFQHKEPKYEVGYRYIYPRGELKNDSILCGYSEPQTVSKVITAAEFLGEKTDEKDPNRFVWCEVCQKKDQLRKFVGSSHKWRELTDAERGEKPVTATEPAKKHELVKTFGDTPIFLDYPPEPVKIPEKIDSNHCVICRCDKRVELHRPGCKNSDGRVLKSGLDDIKAEKPISDKPNKKAYTRWFENFTHKLMN